MEGIEKEAFLTQKESRCTNLPSRTRLRFDFSIAFQSNITETVARLDENYSDTEKIKFD